MLCWRMHAYVQSPSVLNTVEVNHLISKHMLINMVVCPHCRWLGAGMYYKPIIYTMLQSCETYCDSTIYTTRVLHTRWIFHIERPGVTIIWLIFSFDSCYSRFLYEITQLKCIGCVRFCFDMFGSGAGFQFQLFGSNFSTCWTFSRDFVKTFHLISFIALLIGTSLDENS